MKLGLELRSFLLKAKPALLFSPKVNFLSLWTVPSIIQNGGPLGLSLFTAYFSLKMQQGPACPLPTQVILSITFCTSCAFCWDQPNPHLPNHKFRQYILVPTSIVSYPIMRLFSSLSLTFATKCLKYSSVPKFTVFFYSGIQTWSESILIFYACSAMD